MGRPTHNGRGISTVPVLRGLSILCLLAVGCAATPGSPVQPALTATVVMDDAQRRDAEIMANQLGISRSEALTRVSEQDAIGELNAKLEQQEAATFAGLWIQQQPDYRVIVTFTRNGPETIKRYVENTSLAPLVQVRTAQASLAELRAAQLQVTQIIRELGLPFSSAIDVQKNQVELYVTDHALFQASLEQAHLQLPEHVAIVVTYEPRGSDRPLPITPVAGLTFPQLRARSSTFMTALLEGKLIAREGCLRVSADDAELGVLIIWQPDYFLNDDNGSVEVLDRDGRVVARVGQKVSMGGGEVPLTAELERQLREPITSRCEGPYWLMGEMETS